MDATTPSMTDAQLRDLEALQNALNVEWQLEISVDNPRAEAARGEATVSLPL